MEPVSWLRLQIRNPGEVEREEIQVGHGGVGSVEAGEGEEVLGRLLPRYLGRRAPGHMMWVQRQDASKDKFGDPDAPNKVTEGEQPPSNSLAGEQQEQRKVTADAEFR